MSITIQRSRDHRSFLVRGFGKRAIVVDLPKEIYDGLETDYEVYWLVNAVKIVKL